MTRRSLLIIACAIVVAVAVVLLWRGLRPGSVPAEPAVDFLHSEVPLDSPELALELVEVRGRVSESVTDWTCRLRCREPDGCHAQLQLEIVCLTGDARRTIKLGGTVRAARNDTAELTGVELSPVGVDAVERVRVLVEQRLGPGAPAPISLD